MNQTNDLFLKKVIDTVEKNYHEDDFNTTRLAVLVHMDRTQLYRRLIHELNLSPSHLIRKYRMQKARQLVEYSDEPLTVVSYQCGYGTYNHFCNVYKNYYKEAPSTTRKRIRG